jgi:predicted amidohydrolase
MAHRENHRESSRFEAGKKAVYANLAECRLGMTICYDLRFPYLFRKLALKGAEVIAVPSAFTQFTGEAHWHVLLRARAIENGCYIIAAAQTGHHPAGRKTYGHSLIVDPWGRVLADAGEPEGLVVADIDIKQVDKIRQSIPSLKNGVDIRF